MAAVVRATAVFFLLLTAILTSAWQIPKSVSVLPCGTTFYTQLNKNADQNITAPATVEWICPPGVITTTRLTVPSTWNGSYVKLSFNLFSSERFMATMLKNGASFLGNPLHYVLSDITSPSQLSSAGSAAVPVVTGDYFETYITYQGSVPPFPFYNNNKTWFEIEKKAGTFNGALVSKSANQAIPASTDTAITFDQESYDLNAWHDNVTNNSRLTVPVGVSKIRILANMKVLGDAGSIYLTSYKNGIVAYQGMSAVGVLTTGASFDPGLNFNSPILDVSAGDYFQIGAFTVKAGGTTVETGNDTWFQIESVPSDWKHALVRRTANQAVSTTPTTINWTAETSDTSAFHDNATNNTRLTVPVGSGITRVRLSGNIFVGSGSGSSNLILLKNGSEVLGSFGSVNKTAGGQRVNAFSEIISVVEGDYFEMQVTSDASVNLNANERTWFSIEEVRTP